MRSGCVLALFAAALLVTFMPAAARADMPEAEPAEQAASCRVHGTGFRNVAGTGTCIGIHGYLRFDAGIFSGAAGSYSTLSRFVPKLDARTETEWGTLRSYAELEFDAATGAGTDFNLLDAYVEISGLKGTLRLGKSDMPFARFLGHGGLNLIDPGGYPSYNAAAISYTFKKKGNLPGGFSAILAAGDGGGHWRAWAGRQGILLEGGAMLELERSAIGALLAHDGVTGEWGATAAFTGRFGRASVKLQGYYSSHAAASPLASAYSIWAPSGALSRWSVLGSVSMQLRPTLGTALTVQWFDAGEWLAQGELQFAPAPELVIVPAIRYSLPAGGWAGFLRVQRDF